MYTRLCNPLLTNTFFLFGARATGKSFLLKELFSSSNTLWFDLLDDALFLTFSRRPAVLEERVRAFVATVPEKAWIVIDEIQRVPKLLNEVHRLIEDPMLKQKVLFALTGSSARKLRRGGANMLGGRAFLNYLYPLTARELGEDFDLIKALTWGTLPGVYSMPGDIGKTEALKTYVATYLREEIREEQIVRSLDPFLRFLDVAAQMSGQIVNFTEIGREAGVNPKAVIRYFEILQDTLLGTFLPAFHRSVRKQQRQSPRFYFFDLGVQRSVRNMLDIPVVPQSYEFGHAFEQFVFMELYRRNQYLRKGYEFSYLRTKDDAEIDLILTKPSARPCLIEIKSSEFAKETDASKLARFKSDFKDPRLVILSRDTLPRTIGSVEILPWRTGIDQILEGASTPLS